MRKIFLASFFLFLVCSCSKDDGILDEGNENPDPERVSLRLNVSKKEAITFESIEFRLVPDKAVSLLDIEESYDSLVWSVPELGGRFKLMEFTNSSSHFTLSWGHSFYNTGRFHTILLGFKDGEAILSDTLDVDIHDKSDFLGKNWRDITASDWANIGSANVFDAEYMIYFRQEYEDGFPSLRVTFRPNDKINQKEYYEQKQEQIILNYISVVYGTPLLAIDKDRDIILSTFHNLFKQESDSYSPRYIWVTNTTNIALVEEFDSLERCAKYLVYAEPKQ